MNRIADERIGKLRELMKERHIDAYIVPTADFHESEYVGTYFESRIFLTGFTGSAGTAVVTMDEAALWVDGRYFVQAEEQIKGTSIILQKMGQEGVPTIKEYLKEKMPQSGVLGFDGRVMNTAMGEELEEALSSKEVAITCQEDLIDIIWTDRPEISKEPVWILDEKFAGKSAKDKINELREDMKCQGATAHILTTLDDIAWLLNIRGNDIECNPMVLSYAMITMDHFYLYIHSEVLNDEVRAYLDAQGVTVKGYQEIYQMVPQLKNETILLEKGCTNYAIYSLIDGSNEILNQINPTVIKKATKNPVEVENMKKAHLKDGVAMVKFIRWLKENVGKIPMTEMSVSNHLRAEQEGNLGLSFHTISAYGEHAAMCHYSATEETDIPVEARGLYLVDSGGQYYEGTTDITRTIAVGELTKEEREHFTLTVISMLRLGAVKFLHGCRGVSLDYVAREPFWSRGLDYNHGTGHGVGFLANVHERPNGIRFRIVPERQDSCILEEGMIMSDEPGIYIAGSHGSRTENLVVCKKAEKNEYGQFMEFEYLTFVPLDIDGLDLSVMTDRDICLLNEYHANVYEKISPFLTEEEKAWLANATREVKRA